MAAEFLTTPDVNAIAQIGRLASDSEDSTFLAAVGRAAKRTAKLGPVDANRLVDVLQEPGFDQDEFTAASTAFALVEVESAAAERALDAYAIDERASIRQAEQDARGLRQRQAAAFMAEAGANNGGDGDNNQNTAIGLQIFAEGEWQDVNCRVLVLLKGSRFEFRAVQQVGASSPRWSGMTSGGGPRKTVVVDDDGDITVQWDGQTYQAVIRCVQLQIHSLEYVSSTKDAVSAPLARRAPVRTSIARRAPDESRRECA